MKTASTVFLHWRRAITKLTFELPGFSTQAREGVHIPLGFTATVNVKMSVGGQTEAITVTAETSTIDLQANNVTTNFEDQQLKNLTGSRDLWAVLSQAPAIAQTKNGCGWQRWSDAAAVYSLRPRQFGVESAAAESTVEKLRA